MAATQVLSTPELLETIILHLPPQSLPTSQLVSHFWDSIIKNSPSFQQALFRRRCKPYRATTNRIHICDLNTTCFEILSLARTGIVLNPLFTSPAKRNRADRSMLLTQPPLCKTFFVSNYISEPPSQDFDWSTFRPAGPSIKAFSDATIQSGSLFHLGAMEIHQRDGITMGSLLEAIEREEKRFHAARYKGKSLRIEMNVSLAPRQMYAILEGDDRRYS